MKKVLTFPTMKMRMNEMTIDEIIEEIERQTESVQYLRNHPEIAKHTMMHETDEYCRGALNMLNYLKMYIELNK